MFFVYQKEEDCKMEMNKKYARSTPAQLRLYVAFCKDHPELLQGKNCPTSPHLIDKLWEEISRKLNAMVGPSRTPDAWRESFRNWRKQLRARARKLAAGRRQTGGGQNTAAELTEFEQQALEVFGLAAVEGHSSSRLGFQNANNAENVPPRNFTPAQITSPVPDDPNEFASFCLVVSESPSQTPSRPSTPHPGPSPTSSRPITPHPAPSHTTSRPSTPHPGPSPTSSRPITPHPAPSHTTSRPVTPHPAPNSEVPSDSPRQILLPPARNRGRGVRDEILQLLQEDMRDRRHEQSRLAQALDNLANGLSSLAAAVHEMVALQRQNLG